jgi:arylsulfatase A-like enzyme
MLRRLLQKPATWFAAAALLLIAGLASQIRINLPPRSSGEVADLRGLRDRDDLNVLFIVVDTLRADHLSAYGYERPTTPFLEEIARHGIRFERVRAQSSWTKTSMASLWTGRFAARTAVFDYSHVIPNDLKLGAQAFRDAGFRTAGMIRNTWLIPSFGFDRGFEVYFVPIPSNKRERFQQARPGQHQLPGTDLDIVDAALEFYAAHPRERTFVYLHMMDAHQYLYEQGSALFGANLMDSYDNAIHWTDRVLSALFKELADRDLLRRTLIVIASDHGEAFREHGTEGHARNLYREVTDVPLIVSPPFNLPEPVVVEEMVRNVDVVPTLLDLAGLPPLPHADGVSLLPLIEAVAEGRPTDGVAPKRDFALLDRGWGESSIPRVLSQTITADGWRLMVEECIAGGTTLYELASDPHETRSVAAEHPERVAALEAELNAHFAAGVSEGAAEQVELDPAQLEQLRALGYVVGAPNAAQEQAPVPCQTPPAQTGAEPAQP